ncbi:MAG: hypothetical protein GX358_00815 [candidate division WS1 bacterium]|nr:hypothetical protein [candidate division WS1 bacterium]
MRYSMLAPGCILMLCLIPLVALAQGQATILEPISPTDLIPLNLAPVMAVNDAGHIMVAWWIKRGDECVVATAYNAGSGWQIAEPAALPKGRYDVDLYDMAWHDGKFALLVHKGGSYVYVWSGGSWGAPMELPKGSAGRYINFDTDGNLVVFAFTSGQGTRFMRHAGGEW